MTEPDPTLDIFQLPERSSAELPLAAWYAQPLDRNDAQRAVALAQHGLRRVYTDGGDVLPGTLLLLMGGFWLNRRSPAEVDTLLAALTDSRQQALAQLVYGQLLASVRHPDAMARLDAGFALAAKLLSADEYFLVMKRHDALRILPSREPAAAAQDLQTLLTDAAVIQRLRGKQAPRPSTTEGAHLDTLD